MNWKEYSKLALRTESIPPIQYLDMPGQANDNFDISEEREINTALFAKATRLLHAAMGLVTETDELLDYTDQVNLIEELGDCFWYLPIFEYYFPELKLNDIFVGTAARTPALLNAIDDIRHMQRSAAHLIDQIGKRHIIYGKPLNVRAVQATVKAYAYYLRRVCMALEIDIAECWEANIKKLEKRYPDLRFNGDDAVNRNVANELSHIEVAEDLKTKDAAYEEGAIVSMDNQIKFRWNALKGGIGVDLEYNSPPAEVARKVLEHLNCTEDYAKTLLGEEFTRCRFTIVHDGDFQILTAVPFEEKQELLDAKAFNRLLRNEFTPNQIHRIAICLAFEVGNKFRKEGKLVLASAIGAIYRDFSGQGDVLADDTVSALYDFMDYPRTVEALLTVMRSILKEPKDAGHNSSAG